MLLILILKNVSLVTLTIPQFDVWESTRVDRPPCWGSPHPILQGIPLDGEQKTSPLTAGLKIQSKIRMKRNYSGCFRGCLSRGRLGALPLAWPLQQGDTKKPLGRPKNKFKLLYLERKRLLNSSYHCRPHFSKFAVEVAEGKMAGLVPDTWKGGSFMEVISICFVQMFYVWAI